MYVDLQNNEEVKETAYVPLHATGNIPHRWCLKAHGPK
jgi:hypothetical protein